MSREVMQQVLKTLKHAQENFEDSWIDAIAVIEAELGHIPDAGKMVGPERQPLPAAKVKALLRIGPVYAPDGLVTRTGIEYRKELHEAALWGWRCAEGIYDIKEQA